MIGRKECGKESEVGNDTANTDHGQTDLDPAHDNARGRHAVARSLRRNGARLLPSHVALIRAMIEPRRGKRKRPKMPAIKLTVAMVLVGREVG